MISSIFLTLAFLRLLEDKTMFLEFSDVKRRDFLFSIEKFERIETVKNLTNAI